MTGPPAGWLIETLPHDVFGVCGRFVVEVPAAWAIVLREAVKIAAGDGLIVETGAPVELVVTVGSDMVGRGHMTIVTDGPPQLVPLV